LVPGLGIRSGANYYYDGPIYASNPERIQAVVANVQPHFRSRFTRVRLTAILGPQTRAGWRISIRSGLEPTGTETSDVRNARNGLKRFLDS